MRRKRSYTTYVDNYHLYDYIERTYCLAPHPELRIAHAVLIEDSLICLNCEEIVSIIMYLLIKYAYPIESEYGKFTIHYTRKIPWGIVPFAIGIAITFRKGGENKPVINMVEELVRLKAEIYNSEDDVLTSIFIRIYLTGIKSSAPRNFTEDKIENVYHFTLG